MLLELGNLTVLELVQRARAGLVHYLIPHKNYFEIQIYDIQTLYFFIFLFYGQLSSIFSNDISNLLKFMIPTNKKAHTMYYPCTFTKIKVKFLLCFQ